VASDDLRKYAAVAVLDMEEITEWACVRSFSECMCACVWCVYGMYIWIGEGWIGEGNAQSTTLTMTQSLPVRAP
jgi:hypothetical protein